MNRPANPNREEHRRLTSEGNTAAGRGDYAESQRLWNEAIRLKREGIEQLERELALSRSQRMEPPPRTDERLFTESIGTPGTYAAMAFMALVAVILLGALVFIVTVSMDASKRCEQQGGVWISRPGECVQPFQP